MVRPAAIQTALRTRISCFLGHFGVLASLARGNRPTFEIFIMDHAIHNKIVSFIWSLADDCLRDVFVCVKYRDVILPMFVLRRIDRLLEDT